MLSQNYRISNQRLINKLNKEGKAYRTSHFVFKFLPSHLEGSKFAAVVSKKVAAKAVKRNKLRRQITESLRLNLDLLKKPIVCLVILKKACPACPPRWEQGRREATESLDYSVIDSQIKEFFKKLSADV